MVGKQLTVWWIKLHWYKTPRISGCLVFPFLQYYTFTLPYGAASTRSVSEVETSTGLGGKIFSSFSPALLKPRITHIAFIHRYPSLISRFLGFQIGS